MPPSSLPTGTLDSASGSARTFPASESEADAASRPVAPTAAVIPRREHDLVLDRARRRIEELERQNEQLREHITERDRERQAVVDRYERLLARRQREAAAAKSSANATHDETTDGDGLLLRLARRLGLR